MLCPGCANSELLLSASTRFGTCLTVMLNPPLCGMELSVGVEITGGVVTGVVFRATVSIGVGVGVGTGVGRGVGRGVAVGIVRGGLLAANSVRVCVRSGVRTTGFLTVMDEATLCPATASGCVEGCLGLTRRVRPVLRRGVGDATLFWATSVGVVLGGGVGRRACGAGLVLSTPVLLEADLLATIRDD